MKKIDRRKFLKVTGVAAGTAALASACAPKKVKNTGENGEMEYRINTNNGDKVSLLGYGCMRWKMIKDADGKEIIDQESVNELVDYAIEHGVNYFDTSPVYLQGQSETATGIALARHPRESYFLATKLSNFGIYTKEQSLKMYYDSFKELHTDYFDYYLLHSIGRGGDHAFNERYVDNGILDFLLEERKAGRIRNLGFSFHGNQENFDYLLGLHEKYHWDFIQIEMNYIDWRHADGVRNVNAEYLYEKIAALDIPIIIMEPLLGGRLASLPDNIADKLKEREPQKSLASWAFRFVGSYPKVLCILSGMTYRSDLEDNVDTFTNFKPLTGEEKDFLEHMAIMYSQYPIVNCTNCKYCMPCPWGIDIPGIFKHYNTCINEGIFAGSRDESDYARNKRKYLTSYNKAIPTVRQADHCIFCRKCLPACPQSINIPRELKRIDDYIEKLKQDTL